MNSVNHPLDGILSSRFGVIELTERNPNVMFEFDFLIANQKPVFVLYNKAIAGKISRALTNKAKLVGNLSCNVERNRGSNWGVKTY